MDAAGVGAGYQLAGGAPQQQQVRDLRPALKPVIATSARDAVVAGLPAIASAGALATCEIVQLIVETASPAYKVAGAIGKVAAVVLLATGSYLVGMFVTGHRVDKALTNAGYITREPQPANNIQVADQV